MAAIESAWSLYGGDVGLKPRQLFITRSQRLADKVKGSFTRLYGAYVSDSAYTREGTSAADADNAYWINCLPLPKSFSEAKPAHFPMFLSFDAVS